MTPISKIVTLTFMIHIIGPRPTSTYESSCGYARIWKSSDKYDNSRTLYDKKQEKCVIALGSLCNHGESEVRASTNCPTNGFCLRMNDYSLYGYCICSGGYVKGESDAICGKIVGHGESCQNEKDGGDALFCDIHSGLTCQNGTCKCLSPETTVSENKCKPLVGEKCYTYSMGFTSKLLCPDRATCGKQSTTPDYKCECQKGYLTTDDGKCGGGPGTECGANNTCYNTLACIDGECVCPQTLNQIFHDHKKTCINLVGASCDVEKDNCTEFSECTKFFGCICKDGYVETPERTCRPNGSGHGDTCESGTCNAGRGLACFKGVCQCVDSSLEYDNGWCVASDRKRCGWMTLLSGKKCNEGIKDCKSYFIGCEYSSSCVYQSKGFLACQ